MESIILIKSDHPYAYKSGEWGMIVTDDVTIVNNRPCFDIIWPDGSTDVWPWADPAADYKFREVPLDKDGTV